MAYEHHVIDSNAFADFANFNDAGCAEEHSAIYLCTRVHNGWHELEAVAACVVNVGYKPF